MTRLRATVKPSTRRRQCCRSGCRCLGCMVGGATGRGLARGRLRGARAHLPRRGADLELAGAGVSPDSASRGRLRRGWHGLAGPRGGRADRPDGRHSRRGGLMDRRADAAMTTPSTEQIAARWSANAARYDRWGDLAHGHPAYTEAWRDAWPSCSVVRGATPGHPRCASRTSAPAPGRSRCSSPRWATTSPATTSLPACSPSPCQRGRLRDRRAVHPRRRVRAAAG